jgi:Flp pilus assembly protein TadB
VLIALLLAAGLVVGVPWLVVAAGAVAVIQPVMGMVGVGAGVAIALHRRFRDRRSRPGGETTFFNAMAAELRAGASLRVALGAAAARAPDLGLATVGRRAAAGQPAPAVAAELAHALPRNGRLAGAAFSLAAETGARAADVFETLAQRSANVDELDRERSTLTAQARMSALVVGGAPVALLVALIATGRAEALLEAGPVGWGIALVGGGLEFAGLAVVGFMLRRAGR